MRRTGPVGQRRNQADSRFRSRNREPRFKACPAGVAWGDPVTAASSFQPEALEAARAAAPELRRGFLTEQLGPGWRETAQELECVSVHCNYRYLTRAQAIEAHAAGFWLLCYTVNSPGLARKLFSWGVDAVFTDRLDLFRADFS